MRAAYGNYVVLWLPVCFIELVKTGLQAVWDSQGKPAKRQLIAYCPNKYKCNHLGKILLAYSCNVYMFLSPSNWATSHTTLNQSTFKKVLHCIGQFRVHQYFVLFITIHRVGQDTIEYVSWPIQNFQYCQPAQISISVP